MSVDLRSDAEVTRTRLGASNLLKYASENREEGFFNDVTVITGDLSLSANRMVLACHSRFFEAMFKTNMKERWEPAVEIHCVKSTALKAIIDYFYTESIDINGQTVMDLLAASDYLQVDDVKSFCYEFLESIVLPQNSIIILNAAKLYQIDALTNWIYQYIGSHLSEVALTNDFKCLPKSELVDCLFKENGNCLEDNKCNALITWVLHDQKERQNTFVELFQKLVELPSVSIEFIESHLLNEQMIKDDAACHENLLTTYSELLRLRSRPTRSIVVSLGGLNSSRKVFDVFSIVDQELKTYPELPEETYYHSSLSFEKFVYLIGGKTGNFFFSKLLDNVWRIDLKEQNPIWRGVSSMTVRRSDMGAAVHKNNIVVVGGKGGPLTTLDSAETYNASLDDWEMIASLQESRKYTALVSCESGLYALGGEGEKELLSSVERLRALDGEWENVKPMLTTRVYLAAVNCNGVIYAIGGLTGSKAATATNSVERYDATDDGWSFVKEMKNIRYGHSACVLDGKIIVVGGYGATEKVVREIERYDPVKDVWSVIGWLADKLVHHSVLTI